MSLILVIWIKQEKYYDIERAAGALAKFPGQKSDLKDFAYIISWIKQEKYWDIERAAGAPAKISRTKVRFKRLYQLKKKRICGKYFS